MFFRHLADRKARACSLVKLEELKAGIAIEFAALRQVSNPRLVQVSQPLSFVFPTFFCGHFNCFLKAHGLVFFSEGARIDNR